MFPFTTEQLKQTATDWAIKYQVIQDSWQIRLTLINNNMKELLFPKRQQWMLHSDVTDNPRDIWSYGISWCTLYKANNWPLYPLGHNQPSFWTLVFVFAGILYHACMVSIAFHWCLSHFSFPRLPSLSSIIHLFYSFIPLLHYLLYFSLWLCYSWDPLSHSK